MGPILGMGPEREWRTAHCPLVRDHSSRTLGRIYRAARTDGHGHFRQRHHQFLVVWSEHVGHWPAFIWVHAKSFPMARGLYALPARIVDDCRNSTQGLAGVLIVKDN